MISDEKKEEIRDASDLVEVVEDYVRLKRSGSGFVGLCPFHEEKTPSFNVTPRLGIYKCFGCDASGDVFNFVMEMEGVGFSEAMRTLAERYGVQIPKKQDPEEDERYKEREGIFHALRFAGLYYFRMLREDPSAEQARSYLEERGYDGRIVKRFGLGYAPGGGETLLREADREGIEEEYLLKADLIKPSRRQDGFYDTFRDRLMVPIFSPSGKVIAFAGRVLGDRKEAKYINSAQTPVYNKSEVVYGVNRSKNEIRKEKEAILVEGYTDVITLHQYGIKNVVASSGTALTSGQVRVLKRYGNRIVMIYDSDSAGQAAMKRGMNVALAEGMDVDLLELPKGEDPDSFVRSFGKASFLELKRKEAQDFIGFTVSQAEQRGEMETPTGITTTIRTLLESIAEIPEALSRQVHVQHLHQLTQKYRNSSDKELFDQLGVILKRKSDQARRYRKSEQFNDSNSRQALPPIPAGPAESPPFPDEDVPSQSAAGDQEPKAPVRKRPHYEKELIRLMIQYGSDMIDYVGRICNEQLFEDEQLREFYADIISRFREEREISVDHYLNRKEPYPRLVGDVMLEKETPSERHYEKTGHRFERDRDPFRTAKSTIKTLKLNYLKRYLIQLAEEIKHADADGKRELIGKQKRTQSEISHMERTAAQDLFPDPPGREKLEGGNETFQYKMKEKKEQS